MRIQVFMAFHSTSLEDEYSFPDGRFLESNIVKCRSYQVDSSVASNRTDTSNNCLAISRFFPVPYGIPVVCGALAVDYCQHNAVNGQITSVAFTSNETNGEWMLIGMSLGYGFFSKRISSKIWLSFSWITL